MISTLILLLDNFPEPWYNNKADRRGEQKATESGKRLHLEGREKGQVKGEEEKEPSAKETLKKD